MKTYLSPSLKWSEVRVEASFLVSGEGENADPMPATWSFFDELELD